MSDSTSGPAVGTVAPDFTLVDQAGSHVRLSSLRGQKVILYFYPQAATPGCTTQACDFRDRMDRFEAEGYRVLGVSRDDVDALAAFARDQHLTFPLLSDPDLTVHHAYAAFGDKSMYGKIVQGVIRSTFVIDEEGVVQHALHNVKATGHVEMLRKKLGLAA